MRHTSARVAVLVTAVGIGLGVVASAQPEFDTEQWNALRPKLFADRPIQEGADGVFRLEVPLRPEDGAAVPVVIKAVAPQSPERFIKRIVVVIDKNPEPLASVFHFTPDSGVVNLETQMRVDTYSPMRAIAEMSDGRLYMAAKMVKTAGGCAALPVLDADMATAQARIGRMELRVPESLTSGEPNRVHLIVNHPNYTGFQMHPLKMYPISPYYVTKVTVTFGDRPIFSAETTIANSSDPNFRFFFVGRGAGVLKAEVTDSRGGAFAKTVEVAFPN
jgi:sulfur-oxidizing protein SoxY